MLIAQEISRRMKSELGITVSVGVSFNKIFAKLGSDYKKPDAITDAVQADSFLTLMGLEIGGIADYFCRGGVHCCPMSDAITAAGLTNLGVIDVPEEMREFVDYFDVLMGQPFSLRTNCAVGSFGDTLSINFTSTIIETDVERFFFRKLVQEGLHVKIETNRDMNRSEF